MFIFLILKIFLALFLYKYKNIICGYIRLHINVQRHYFKIYIRNNIYKLSEKSDKKLLFFILILIALISVFLKIFEQRIEGIKNDTFEVIRL